MKLIHNFISILVFILCCVSCSYFKTTSNDKAKLHMQLGLSYLERGNYPLALKELLDAEENDPEDYLVQNNLGLVYFLREKYDLAINHFNRSFELNPKFTEAKNNSARVFIELKQYGLAQKLLDEVLSDLTYPAPEKAYMNYGLLEFNRNRFQKSKIYFRKVLELNRENCLAHVYYGRSILESKDVVAAIDELEKSISFCQSAGIDDAHYFSGIALYRLGDKSKSLVRFKEVLNLFPNGFRRESSKKMIDLIEKGGL